MKHLWLVFAPAVIAAIFSLGAARAVTTYNDSVSGSQTASPDAEGMAINLTASGDLPGMSRVVLRHSGVNVTGGSWTMTVLPQNADASSNERGELSGTITGGTVTLNTDGTLSSASAVQFTIQSGTGEFAGVTNGSGTVSVSSSVENPTQLTGTLVLSF